MHSPACCRLEKATFSPHIHRTWEAYFSPFLYLFPKYIFSLLCKILLHLIPLCLIPISCYTTFRYTSFRYTLFHIANLNVITDS